MYTGRLPASGGDKGGTSCIDTVWGQEGTSCTDTVWGQGGPVAPKEISQHVFCKSCKYAQ